MKLKEIFEKLNELAPFEDAAEWDNSGLLVGDISREILRIMLALDVRGDIVETAIESGAQLILTHHPLIFGSLRRVTDDDFVGRRVLKMAENKISYIAMHTNFDRHVMNIEAAKRLGLKDTQAFAELKCTLKGNLGFGFIGVLERGMKLGDYIEEIKKAFGLEKADYFGDRDRIIQRAAVVSGSGAEFIDEALEKDADLIITGDVKYHNGIDAIEKGICVVDAGHYGIEKLFVPYMKDFIERSMPGVEVVCCDDETPFGAV